MQLDYIRIVLSLLVSVAIGVAIIYVMSRYGFGRGQKSSPSQRIQVLEVRPLGNRTSLVAVSYRDEEVLLVVGPGFATTVLQQHCGAPAQATSSAVGTPHA